ncbi:fluoride efflux transporter CrcB [Aquimarina sp. W85]|uniref:fluoride efflux transporter CrcB n=1 Tax=Aquimarina rhodophyticola TaxID=3342246 RepID=UPI00366D02CE
MKNVFLIFIGGGAGSVLRFLISKLLNNSWFDLPLGTFVVNVVGSFCIGIILGATLKTTTTNTSLIFLLATGFCGGFTTFSTFAYENQYFLKNGDFSSFAIYTLGTITVATAAVFIGVFLAK